MLTDRRLLILSNRLPVAIEKTEEGYRVEPSTGGLVTATTRDAICAAVRILV